MKSRLITKWSILVLNVGLLFIILSLLNNHFSYYGVGAIVVMRLLGLNSLTALAVTSVVAYSTFDDRFETKIYKRHEGMSQALREALGQSYELSFGLKLTILVMVLIGLYGLYRYFTSKIKSMFLRTTLIYVFICVLVSISAQWKTLQPSTYYTFAWLSFAVAMFAHTFVYLNLWSRNASVREFLAVGVQPFYTTSFLPRIVPMPEKSKIDQRVLDREALRYLVLGICTMFFAQLVFSMVEGNVVPFFNIRPWWFDLPNFRKLGLSVLTVSQYPRWQFILYIFCQAVYFIFSMQSFNVAVDAIYRTLGYSMPRHFVFPWGVRTYAEFFTAVMPYYSNFLTVVFYYPIYRVMLNTKLTRGLLRYLALYLAILLFGLLFHSLRDVDDFYRYDFAFVLARQIENSLVYFTALYIGLLWIRGVSFGNRVLSSGINLLLFMAYEAFIAFLRIDYLWAGEVEKLKILKYLLFFY